MQLSPRRSFLAGAAAGLLGACGGGAVSQAPAPSCPRVPALVSCRGDSLTSGSIAPSPTVGGGAYLDVRPVERLQQLLAGAALCIDHGVPAQGVGELVPGWASSLRVEPASVLVLRWGGADAIGGTEPDAFEQRLLQITRQALAAGKRVVLPGLIQMARKAEWQDVIGMTADVFADRAARAAAIDASVRRVAQATGAAWVDIRALRFDGAADIADAVHPAQAYSDRCAQAIAAAVLPLLTN